MTESETPRTDAIAKPMPHPNDLVKYVPADFARQLERELAAARESCASAAGAATVLEAELKAAEKDRLEQRVVPNEPTKQMLAAGIAAWTETCVGTFATAVTCIYKAMIAAAPQNDLEPEEIIKQQAIQIKNLIANTDYRFASKEALQRLKE